MHHLKVLLCLKLIKATQLKQRRRVSPKKSFQGICDHKWATYIELGRGRTWFRRLHKFTSPQAKDLQMEIVWDCGSMDFKLELEYLNISTGHCLWIKKSFTPSPQEQACSLPLFALQTVISKEPEYSLQTNRCLGLWSTSPWNCGFFTTSRQF